jgi:hypothetical protein
MGFWRTLMGGVLSFGVLTMYECHVTIEPVLDEGRLNELKGLAAVWGFKVADLLMRNEEKSRNDTFLTGHNQDYVNMKTQMEFLIDVIKHHGYTIWRYKIENIILDSKYQGDTLNLL